AALDHGAVNVLATDLARQQVTCHVDVLEVHRPREHAVGADQLALDVDVVHDRLADQGGVIEDRLFGDDELLRVHRHGVHDGGGHILGDGELGRGDRAVLDENCADHRADGEVGEHRGSHGTRLPWGHSYV